MMKEVSLGDTSLFRFTPGKRVTDAELEKSKGKIPTYSANVFYPRYFLKKSNINNFRHNSVLYGIDGDFELSAKPKGAIFGTTDHCGRIVILDSNILPDYLIHQLDIKRAEFGFGRTKRANLGNMSEITIEIPKNNGKFDKKIQTTLIKKYIFLNEIRKELEIEKKYLENIILELNDKSKTKPAKISEIYNFAKTNSHMTKELCNINRGNIPVYGCSKNENEILGRIKKNVSGVKYYKDSLAWNRNGSVGRFFIRKGIFSTNEDHRVLKLKRKYIGKIDPLFMKFTLEKEIRKLGFAFLQKLGQSNMANIEINIPVNQSKKFSIKKQKEIAQKYEKLYGIKNAITKELDELSKITVTLSH